MKKNKIMLILAENFGSKSSNAFEAPRYAMIADKILSGLSILESTPQGIEELINRINRQLQKVELISQYDCVAVSDEIKLLKDMKQVLTQHKSIPTINWRKYPDEKPENKGRIYVNQDAGEMVRILPQNIDKMLFNVYYWFYESDLLATFPPSTINEEK